jgi:D-amino peptidase
VIVKESISRFAARSLHPDVARRAISEGAATAMRSVRAGGIAAPAFDRPIRLEVDFLTADMADMATWIRGVERSGPRSTVIETADALAAFRAFIATVYLTRQAEGR